ncbi:MAG: CRTAC1 family protein [Acidobacteriota bacterium]
MCLAGLLVLGLLAVRLFAAAGAGRGAHPVTSSNPDALNHDSPFHFVDVTQEAGLDRIILAGRPDKDHLLDSAGNGVAWLDYDNDGWLDIYLVNAWRMEGSSVVEKGKNALYRNRGDGTFEDVTDRAGVGGEGHWGAGVAVADYDNDGDVDILVTNFGPNVLYQNQGDGTFRNVAARAGIESPGWNTGATFFDADGDGDLDLYIAGYITCTLAEVLAARPSLDWKGVAKVAVGPFGLDGAPDHFFLNQGDGTFREATVEAGMTDQTLGFGFAVRAADYDADGDLDVYVANDSDPNYMYRNEGGGRFQEVGLWTGCALDANGAAQAGMGLAVGDVNLDGLLDIFVNNFSEDYSTLYLNTGEGFFDDVSKEAGIGPPTFKSLSWGAVLADLDNDTDLDLVIANGHIYPQVDRYPEIGLSYNQRNQIFLNDGTGRFVEVTDRAGPGFALIQCSRGIAAGDYDNDGDLDLLYSNLDGTATLLRNDSRTGNWLIVDCRVPAGSGPLVGTELRAYVGEKLLLRDIASSDSYVSAHDRRVHFGLDAAQRVDRLEITWPDRQKTVLTHVAANQILNVRKPAR